MRGGEERKAWSGRRKGESQIVSPGSKGIDAEAVRGIRVSHREVVGTEQEINQVVRKKTGSAQGTCD